MHTTLQALTITRARSFRIIMIAAISDLLLYIFSFAVVLLIKEGSLENYIFQPSMISAFLFSWAFSSILTRKHIRLAGRTFLENVRAFFLSFFILIGSMSLLADLQLVPSISRLLLIESLLLSFSTEIIALWLFIPAIHLYKKRIRLIKSRKFFFIELTVLTLTLLLFIIIYFGFFNLYDDLIMMLAGIYLIWFISSVFVHQYRLNFKQNYWSYIGSFIKSYFIFTSLLFFMLFMFDIDFNIKINLAVYSLIYPVWSFLIFSQLYFLRIPKKTDESRLILLENNKVSDNLINLEKISGINFNESEAKLNLEESLRHKLKDIYLNRFPRLFEFINSKINLNSISLNKSVFLRSSDIYNVEILPNNRLELFMNLHELNDLRRINSYLSEVNNKLIEDGIFIGKFETIKFRYRKYITKYPFYFAIVFFLLDIFWSSIIPKVPFMKKIFFSVNNGKGRLLSTAEGIGRLYYNGFKLISGFELDNYFYFIAQKNGSQFKDENPSYGMLFKMRREGKDGKDIFVYKLRTMHPYSEYIQKFVYDINNLEIGGKIKNDFRITVWGKLLRRLWIDELPMIINLFKGDIKLVGVRPLSKHYLSLYTEELREKRRKFKPGLLPPFYADMPRTIQEIIESETRYLDAYEKNPFLTDAKYFIRILSNILIKKKRSA